MYKWYPYPLYVCIYRVNPAYLSRVLPSRSSSFILNKVPPFGTGKPTYTEHMNISNRASNTFASCRRKTREEFPDYSILALAVSYWLPLSVSHFGFSAFSFALNLRPIIATEEAISNLNESLPPAASRPCRSIGRSAIDKQSSYDQIFSASLLFFKLPHRCEREMKSPTSKAKEGL